MDNESNNTNKGLTLIPKSRAYIEYMILIIMKLPRTERFNIGNEYKLSMYQMLENIMMINKIHDNDEKLNLINRVDAELDTQRIFVRIMYKEKWIDKKKFDYIMNMAYEMGKIIGGLSSYYVKNNKK